MNDDGFTASFSVGFHFATGADVNLAASGAIGFFDTATAIDDRCRWEIWPWDVLHQRFKADIFIFNKGQAAVDHFGDVVRRNVGRHAHGDTRGAIHQQVRNFGGQHFRDLLIAVVVRHKVHGLFFEIREQFVSNFGHAHFGITHGSSGVAINRTEVTLTIYQHITQRKRLRHTNNRVVHRRVTVRVIFTNDVADHTGGFFIRFVPVVTEFTHRIKYAAMHRLQAIANIR